MSNTPDHQSLEQFTDAVLRDLPPRRAPASLEARVFAELERRAARPWWQSSYRDWPAIVRILFLAACVALGSLAVRATEWLFGRSASTISGIESDLSPAAASVKATAGAFSFIAHNIPSVWIYGAIAVMAVTYIALFGIGAAAYRTLYANR
ncbi:MAG TPA: hypothetical protein PKE27_00750 [Povalibacter sp.]|uniref:hypothetical protein n=1 Tax=Povalibacter sp. TaxID=1962978 RepID=UPI002BB40B4A|nr:hypothetical protein [Povalibacter sp.]HMN43077.1 hypothetical protein [Povalibacter sp.]